MKTWFSPDGFIGDDPSSRHNARMLLLFGAIIIAAFSILVYDAWGATPNGFVQMLERREGMLPGQTKVLQECSCTVRYLGTTVHGNVYDVRLQKLD